MTTLQDVQDEKMRRKAEDAYNKSLTVTEAAPMPRPAASAPVRKYTPQVEEMLQEVRDAKMRQKISDMGYAKGGSVSSASRRGDGIAQRGKTQGKMIAMKKGGKCK